MGTGLEDISTCQRLVFCVRTRKTGCESFRGKLVITYMTVPAPVWIPQPSAASFLSSSRGASTLTVEFSFANIIRLIELWPKKRPPSGFPESLVARVVPSSLLPEKLRRRMSSQYGGRPCRQVAQVPQLAYERMTESPGFTERTSLPISLTVDKQGCQ